MAEADEELKETMSPVKKKPNSIVRHIKPYIAVLGADIIFFNLVDPAVSSFVIVVGCILLAATIYCLTLLSSDVIAMFVGTSARTRRRAALFVTAPLTFLILMQSIGQLSGRDVLAAVALTIIFYIYVSYVAGRRALDQGPHLQN